MGLPVAQCAALVKLPDVLLADEEDVAWLADGTEVEVQPVAGGA